jgi:hypothetical protein
MLGGFVFGITCANAMSSLTCKTFSHLSCGLAVCGTEEETNRKTWDEPQWIVAQGPLSALTIPRFMLSRLQKICRFRNLKLQISAQTL